MKFLHTADIHLGAKNIKLSLDKQSQIRAEQNALISRLFDRTGEDYDAVLICGDLFHNKSVPAGITSNFFRAVEEFGRPVLYIKGNHDEKFDFKNLPSNFVILDEDNPFVSFGDTVIYGQVSPETISKSYDKTKTNILMLHGDIQNRTSGDFIDVHQYVDKFDFKYVALGHVHSYSEFKLNKSVMVYSGSLFSNGFDESGDKGFVEIYTDELKFTFHPFATRRYMICSCDITDILSYKDMLNKIKAELSKNACKESDLIRIILTGYYTEESNKYINAIKTELSNYFYLEIVDQSKLKIDFDKIKEDTLSFKAEFLLLVEQNESGAVKEKICQLGIEALRGDDISI